MALKNGDKMYLPENDDLLDAALAAQKCKDWPTAIARWRKLRNLFPDIVSAWASEAAVLLVVGQMEEAEVLIANAEQRFPESIEIASTACAVAVLNSAWLIALKRWHRITRNFSTHPYLATEGARLAAIIEAAVKTLSEEDLAMRAAEAAQRGDWDMAAGIRIHLLARAPQSLGRAIDALLPLKELGQFDEADRAMEVVMAGQPQSLEAKAYHAELAVSRGDRLEAARRWRQVYSQFPTAFVVAPLAVAAFRDGGEFDLADRFIDSAITNEPERIELRIHKALVKARAGDWEAAADCWTDVVHLAPRDFNFLGQRGDAMWHAGLERLEQGRWHDEKALAKGLSGDQLDDAFLALRFIAFGDGCEFGVIQRLFGAEPMDMLRFSGISALNLAAAIKSDFKNIANAEMMELTVGKDQEYFVDARDKSFFSHGFLHVGEVESELFFKRQLLRLELLARKLMRDLNENSKIFIHHAPKARISDDEIHYLYRSMREKGATRLVVTRRPENGNAPGTVCQHSPGTMIGYFDMEYGERRDVIDLASWRSLMMAASGAFSEAKPG